MAQLGEHRPGFSGDGKPQAPVRRAARPAWWRYIVAVLTVVVAIGVRAGPLAVLGTHSPFVTFYPAVMLAALFGGFGPGMLAALLSAFTASFWMEPVVLPFIRNPADWLLVLVFLVSCMMISGICEAMRRARVRVDEGEA